MSYVSLLLPLVAAPAASGHAAVAEARCADGPAALETILAAVRTAHASLDALVNSLRVGEAQPVGDDLDTAIALAESVETAGAADHATLLRLVEAAAKAAERLPLPQHELVTEINRTAVAASADCLKAVRGFRWELLACRAASDPAPVASDTVGTFDQYLNALLGA